MDQLGIPLKGGVHELKIGSSFSSKKATSDSPAFHAFRYDFKPASIDSSKPSTVSVGEKNEVNVVMPNVEGSAQPMSHFKGPKREAKKQCVLILNHDTGEITLERLSCDVVLKRQRLDGTSKAYVKTVIPPSTEKNGAAAASSSSAGGVSGSHGSTSSTDMGPTLPAAQGASMSQLKKNLKKKKKSANAKTPVCATGDDDSSKSKALQSSPPKSSAKPSATSTSSSLTTSVVSTSPAALFPISSSPVVAAVPPKSHPGPTASAPSKPSPANRLSSSSSSSSSSSDDSSGAESDGEEKKKAPSPLFAPAAPVEPVASKPPPAPAAPTEVDYRSLQDDLRLSESGSDSD